MSELKSPSIFSRDLHLAQAAYERRDPVLSMQAHSRPPQHEPLLAQHRAVAINSNIDDELLDLEEDEDPNRLNVRDEGHYQISGSRERSLAKGAQRGISSTFFVICAMRGADLSCTLITVISCALLLCTSLAEGIERYLHRYYKRQYKMREAQREYWELENYPEGECREMIELYTSNGIEEEDAKAIILRMAKYPGFFVNHMLVEELGMLPPHLDAPPMSEAASFAIGSIAEGFLPILPFLLARWFSHDPSTIFAISATIFLICSFKLGALRGKMYLWRSGWPVNGVTHLLKEGLIAVIAFTAGYAVRFIQ